MTAAITRDAIPARILDYLATKLPDAKALRLEHLERIAVGLVPRDLALRPLLRPGRRSVPRWPLPATRLRQRPAPPPLRSQGAVPRPLQCLEATPLPTPRPYWYEDDPGILGAPFLVMEKVPGECPNPWGREGRKYYAEAADRGALPASFTDTLATLHTLDWREAGLEFLGVPEGGASFALAEVAKWRELIAVSNRPPEPILTDLIAWLEENAPTTDRVCLVHGAYRTGNLLIDNDRVSAVLDWELQVLGDPMYDVAYVLSDLNREGTELLSNLVPRPAFFDAYEQAAGWAIDEEVCRYYEALYAMRSVAFWMSAAGLFAEGRSDDLRLARTAWSVPVVLGRAGALLGY